VYPAGGEKVQSEKANGRQQTGNRKLEMKNGGM
jgi:hypothetical protein